MRLRSSFSVGVVALAVAALGRSASAGVNLVQNGGFESGDFSGWITQAAGAGSNFFVQNGSGFDSPHAAFFGGTGGLYDQISQDLTTIAGGDYLLEFWILNLGVENDGLLVEWGGTTLLDGPVESELETYVYFSFEVTAAEALTELRFGGFDGNAGFYLDGVSVTAVPTPAVLALLTIAGVANRRRRR